MPFIINAIRQNSLSDKSLKVYPNPSGDFINIEFEPGTNIDNYDYALTNSLGKNEKLEELTKQNKMVTLNVSHVKSGIYLLLIMDKGQVVRNEKIIKD